MVASCQEHQWMILLCDLLSFCPFRISQIRSKPNDKWLFYCIESPVNLSPKSVYAAVMLQCVVTFSVL